MGRTKIEYVTDTWNPITGCTKTSAGCMNCWAERMAFRLAAMGVRGYSKQNPFGVTFHPERLDEPNHWRKPRRVFVCDMGDIFHGDVPSDWLLKVFRKMAEVREVQHTFLLLTKRPEWGFNWWERYGRIQLKVWPENVWVGVTAENQETANYRIPWLVKFPAKVRWVSMEPLIGPIDLWEVVRKIDVLEPGPGSPEVRLTLAGLHDLVQWYVVGCESGPGARKMEDDWVRGIRDQVSESNGVSFFLKQQMEIVGDEYGANVRLKRIPTPFLDGRSWTEIPNGG